MICFVLTVTGIIAILLLAVLRKCRKVRVSDTVEHVYSYVEINGTGKDIDAVFRALLRNGISFDEIGVGTCMTCLRISGDLRARTEAILQRFDVTCIWRS